jgi:hypothetical protein
MDQWISAMSRLEEGGAKADISDGFYIETMK